MKAALLLLAICLGITIAQDVAWLRFGHSWAVEDNIVDVYIDDKVTPIWNWVNFKHVSSYVPIEPGAHSITLRRASQFSTLESFDILTAPVGEEVVLRANIELQPGQYYSFSFFRMGGQDQPENVSAPSNGLQGGEEQGWRMWIDEFEHGEPTFLFRYIHTSLSVEALDVWLIAGANTTTDLGEPLYSGLESLANVEYMDMPAGVYNLIVREAGAEEDLIRVSNILLGEGNIYSAWGMGVMDGDEQFMYTAILKYDNWVLLEDGMVCPSPNGLRPGNGNGAGPYPA